MSQKKVVNLALNRVEGDLELKIELDSNKQIVTDAWCIGTMFRGFEQILEGRAAMDGLVITPRICGICGTAHLYAAVTALEMACQWEIAPNGTRIRNLCLMAEEVQSDSRQSFLMFTIDFFNQYYRERYKTEPIYSHIVEAFEPFKGRIYRETVQHTKKILEIVALFGGQWPHSSYMIPGGVTSVTNQRDLIRALSILDEHIKWYENSILGCSSEEWLALKSVEDFKKWIDKRKPSRWNILSDKKTHQYSAIELFYHFGYSMLELHKLGKGKSNLLSYGAYFDPEKWQPPFEERCCLRQSGFYHSESAEFSFFSPQGIKEHLKYSWYKGKEGGCHPSQGITEPEYIAPKTDEDKYSWAKAPRYKDTVVEVGSLAELVLAYEPLIMDFFRKEGSNVWLRQFARLHRPVVTMKMMRETILETLKNIKEPFYYAQQKGKNGEKVSFNDKLSQILEQHEKVEGEGLIQATRGCLGHWITLKQDEKKDNKIAKYQIITPTNWNASPRDSSDVLGHWEQTLKGTKIKSTENPVEIEHIIRSHDACLVCTVHFLNTGKKMRFNLAGGTVLVDDKD